MEETKRVRLTNGDFGVSRARVENGVLYFEDYITLGEREMVKKLDKLGISYKKIECAEGLRYKIDLPGTAKIQEVGESNVEFVIDVPALCSITAYAAVDRFETDIDECELEDFLEYMMVQLGEPDDRILMWDQDAHTIKISAASLWNVTKYLKKWPDVEAIGEHSYGDMARIFTRWLDANKGGDTVVIKFGDAFED